MTSRVRSAAALAYFPVVGIWLAKRYDNSLDGLFVEHHRVNAGLLLLLLISFETAGIAIWLLSGACIVVLTMHTPDRSSEAIGTHHNYFRWIQYSGLALFAFISLIGAVMALSGRQLPMPRLPRVKR